MKKAERKFLRPAVVFGWEIEIVPWRKTPLWDGDGQEAGDCPHCDGGIQVIEGEGQ